ncbi:hypothetical protein [Undibacterium sp.]|uniref:hypothetical protein n=1 Tax=Undibacterium sp. TaxID=1914977 RepID=UPI0027320ADC|nr:hypothetical protein [Undibacterium sp.]MDP1978360.1 hypothetical protein [Undibacterium sp.]
MQAQDLEFVRNSILSYLQARPNSADTVEGIQQFWIQWRDDALPLSVVSGILETMRNAGELEIVNLGGRTIWCAAR